MEPLISRGKASNVNLDLLLNTYMSVCVFIPRFVKNVI